MKSQHLIHKPPRKFPVSSTQQKEVSIFRSGSSSDNAAFVHAEDVSLAARNGSDMRK